MIDEKIDLRGIRCPVNYLKTKLKLEEMEAGQVLEVFIDDGEPILHVPRSVKEDGHRILEIHQIENYFRILVERGKVDGRSE